MSEVELVLRFALGAVFLPAGLSKLPNLQRFEEAVRDYRLISPRYTSVLAIVVALTEALVGLLLLTGALVLVAAAIAGCLLAVFSAAVAISLVRGRHIPCGCIGTLGTRTVSAAVLVRNAVLAAAAIGVLALSSPAAFVGLHDSAHRLPEADGVAMLITGTLCMLVLSITDETLRVLKSQAGFRRAMVNV